MIDDLMATLTCNSIHLRMQHLVLQEAKGDGDVREVRRATYRLGSFVNRRKASPANLLQSSVATDSHFLMCWIFSPLGRRGRWLFSRHDRRSDAGVLLLSVQLTRFGAALPLQMRVKGSCQGVVHWKCVWWLKVAKG